MNDSKFLSSLKSMRAYRNRFAGILDASFQQCIVQVLLFNFYKIIKYMFEQASLTGNASGRVSYGTYTILCRAFNNAMHITGLTPEWRKTYNSDLILSQLIFLNSDSNSYKCDVNLFYQNLELVEKYITELDTQSVNINIKNPTNYNIRMLRYLLSNAVIPGHDMNTILSLQTITTITADILDLLTQELSLSDFVINYDNVNIDKRFTNTFNITSNNFNTSTINDLYYDNLLYAYIPMLLRIMPFCSKVQLENGANTYDVLRKIYNPSIIWINDALEVNVASEVFKTENTFDLVIPYFTENNVSKSIDVRKEKNKNNTHVPSNALDGYFLYTMMIINMISKGFSGAERGVMIPAYPDKVLLLNDDNSLAMRKLEKYYHETNAHCTNVITAATMTLKLINA